MELQVILSPHQRWYFHCQEPVVPSHGPSCRRRPPVSTVQVSPPMGVTSKSVSYGSSSLEVWALKPPMRVWGAALSNGEPHTLRWWETQTPCAARLWVCHQCHHGGGGCGHKGKATQGGGKSCRTRGLSQKKVLKDLVSTSLRKRFLWVVLKMTLENIT